MALPLPNATSNATTTGSTMSRVRHLLSLLVLLSGLTFVRNLEVTMRRMSEQRNHHQHGYSLARSAPINGGFVHIGKTGGSSLSLLLRNGCHSFVAKPCREVEDEGLVSRLVTGYYHVPDFQRLPSSRHSFYILTLRDPFDRAVSGFTYDHPANDHAQRRDVAPKDFKRRIGAYKCFPSLEVFVEKLGDNPFNFTYNLPPNHIPDDPDCEQFAKAALAGRVRRFNHLFFNYQKLKSLLPKQPTTTLMVTRMEHLYQDWNSIHQVLGDSTDTSNSTTLSNPHERHIQNLTLPVSRELSDLGRRRLCHALQEEYNVYFEWLRNAVNISPNNLQQAIEYAQQKCPGEIIIR